VSLASKLAEAAALRRKAAAYETAPRIHRAAGRWRSGSWDQLSEEQQLKLAQEGSTILYAALRIIAVAASSPPWVAERRSGDGWEALPSEHPAAALLDAPNDFDDWRSLLERLVFCLVPTGNHLWHKVTGVGRQFSAKLPPVLKLWPLLPVYQAELGEDDYPLRYTRRALIFGAGYSSGPGRDYLPEEVIHFQRVNARRLGWGSGVVGAAARVIASDIATAEWQQESYENRLVPDGAFVAPSVFTEDQRRVVKDTIEGKSGPSAAREALFLEGGWKFERAGMTALEADYLGTRRAILEEICGAVNLRPALLVPEAKYANLEESRNSLWTENVLPMLAAVAGKVTRQLGPHFGRPGEIRWRPDAAQIEALRDLLLKRVTAFAQLVGTGTPYNHAIELTGLPLPQLDEEIGGVPHGTHVAVMIQRVRSELGLGAERLASARPISGRLAPAASRKALPMPVSKAEARERAARQFAAAATLEHRIAASYRVIAARIRDADEDRLGRIARALLSGDTGAALSAAGLATLRAGLGVAEEGLEALGAGFVPIVGLVTRGAEEGVRLGAAALSEATGRELSVPAVVGATWAASWAPERAEQAVGSTERGLTETAVAWRSLPGWGEAMAAALAGLYAGLAAVNGEQAAAVAGMLAGLIEARGLEEAIRRAERLAGKAAAARGLLLGEQNATRAVFGGQQQAAADLLHRGVLTAGRRGWVDSDDGRVCLECGELDGEEAALDEPYVSPLSGASYMWPGDPHPKCRCGEIYFEIEVSAA
jgi:phage portal protein BeeE